MAATLTSPPIRPGAAESVTTRLAAIHDQWIERIARVLAPATLPRAGFWERWAAVRFLNDQFAARFRLECEFIESLGDRLAPTIRGRLTTARKALEHTRTELTSAGRRRGTGAEVAGLARTFLDQARRWCAALELATATLESDELPERSRTLLARLHTAAGLGL